MKTLLSSILFISTSCLGFALSPLTPIPSSTENFQKNLVTEQIPLPKAEQTPKHRDNGRYYVEVAPFLLALDKPLIPNKIALGYRSMGRINGWETTLSYQLFGGINARYLDFLFNTVSLELGYLPHISFLNAAFYFGIGGGVGVAISNLNFKYLRPWIVYPTVYIKPGFQFNMKDKDRLSHHVDLKMAYPFNASLNYGIGF